MSSHNFDTTWRKGTDHIIPDTLSCHSVLEQEVDDLLGEAEELSIRHIIVRINEELDQSEPNDPILEQVRIAGQSDP